MERKKVINGFTTYFCRIYRCWLTKKGCLALQKRSRIAKKMLLTSDLPKTKSEVSFILDPLLFSEKCPCSNPISEN